jgi:hypothetical protein
MADLRARGPSPHMKFISHDRRSATCTALEAALDVACHAIPRCSLYVKFQSLIHLLENNLLQVQRTPDGASQALINFLEAVPRTNCLSHGTGHFGNLVSKCEPRTARDAEHF